MTIKEIAAVTGVNYERYEGYKKALEENGSIHTDEDYYCLPLEKIYGMKCCAGSVRRI